MGGNPAFRGTRVPVHMLAELLVELSRASVTNIELGRQSVLVDQLCRFANALGVEPVDLLRCAPPSPQERETEALTPAAAAWIDRVRRRVA